MGDNPARPLVSLHVRPVFLESCSLGLERKYGGKLHLKLNTNGISIANKYHEGKMKRTLKRELKVPVIVEKKSFGLVSWSGCFLDA